MGSPTSFPPFVTSHPRVALGIGAILLATGVGCGTVIFHGSHMPLISSSMQQHLTQDRAGGGVSTLTSTQAQSASLTSTAMPTTNPYAGWISEHGSAFSIKRPPSWYGAKDMGLANQGDAITFASEKGKYPFNLSAKGIYVGTGVLPVSGTDLYNQIFASPLGRVTLQGSFDPSNVYTKLATLQLGGYPAVEYSIDYSDNPQGQLNEDFVYVVKRGDEYYSIDFSLNKAHLSSATGVMNDIIHSLTFTK